ncbi:MAG TPA: hypothetical protein VFY12_08465 [Arenimonas sp.]|nr:hypothetical protein [Arenimonas sp.]
MSDSERRRLEKAASFELKRQLNEEQRLTLADLERFGWELKFIRRKPFQPPVPVILDGDRKHYAVLREDGSLDENPGFVIRG